MVNKPNVDASKVRDVPKDVPFVMIGQHILVSPAWRQLSNNARKMVSCLLVEHLSHAGMENGFLKATYKQLEAYGVTRNYIHDTIIELEAFGFLEARYGARINRIKNYMNTYRLTFLKWKEKQEGHSPLYHAPTNEWQCIGEEAAKQIRKRLDKEAKERREKAKKKIKK